MSSHVMQIAMQMPRSTVKAQSSISSTSRPVAPLPRGLGFTPSRQQALPARRQLTVTYAVETEKPTVDKSKPEVAKIADSIGLPTEDGLFGFVPFSEVWVGRLAMMGFLVSLLEEFWTGKGTLQQIGISTPNDVALWTIIGLSGGATLIGTVNTLLKAQNKTLDPKQAQRYKQFFGIQPDSVVNAEAERLKKAGDFTSPESFKDIADARQEGAPIDTFLDNSSKEKNETNKAAADLKSQEARSEQAEAKGPSMMLEQRDDIIEQTTAQSSEWAYAREVEVTNGRFAALGFLACIIVEAVTGRGILGQIILYLKALNILGPASGF